MTSGDRVASTASVSRAVDASSDDGSRNGSDTSPRPAGGRRGASALGTTAWAVLLTVALVASVIIAVTIGPAGLAPTDVFASIGAHLGFGESTLSTIRDGIVWELRMPRVLTAAAVGAGLALCGTVMQALTRNPLADPYLLGLSSGASVGAVVVIAPNTLDTASPASTVRVGVRGPAALASPSVATRAASAPANAATGSRTDAPTTITTTAPTEAPDERPSR